MLLLSSTWHPRLATEPSGFSEQGLRRGSAVTYSTRAYTPASHKCLSVYLCSGEKLSFVNEERNHTCSLCCESDAYCGAREPTVSELSDQALRSFWSKPVEIVIR